MLLFLVLRQFVYFSEDFSFENDTCTRIASSHTSVPATIHLGSNEREEENDSVKTGRDHVKVTGPRAFLRAERKATWAPSVCVSSMFYAFCPFVMISDSAEGRTLGSGVQGREGGVGRAGPCPCRTPRRCQSRLDRVTLLSILTTGLHPAAVLEKPSRIPTLVYKRVPRPTAA